MLRCDEDQAWNGFLSAERKFAGEEIASWVPGPDPPDVLCTTVSGRLVAVELTKWVEQDQLESGKAREEIENAYLRIIASEKERRPGNIGRVCLYDKQCRLNPNDHAQFRLEIYACIEELNALAAPDWDEPQGAPLRDFECYPVLGKYLHSIWIYPANRLHDAEPNSKWILFEHPGGGAYGHESMLKAALDRICAKIADYAERNLHAQYALDELHLLCHYDDKALLYNTPIDTVDFGFEDLAARVAEAVALNFGVFNKIFLFHPWESPKVMQVYPGALGWEKDRSR